MEYYYFKWYSQVNDWGLTFKETSNMSSLELVMEREIKTYEAISAPLAQRSI